MSHPLQAEGAPTRIESRPMRKLAFLLPLLVACQTATPPSADTMSTPPATTTPAAPVVDRGLAVKADTPARLAQLPATVIDYDRSLLNQNEREVVARLIEASKAIDEIFWRQVDE